MRFVQLWCGSGLNGASGNWDNHGDVRPGSDFERMCVRSDKPIAGLLKDLKLRGLLDETRRATGRPSSAERRTARAATAATTTATPS